MHLTMSQRNDSFRRAHATLPRSLRNIARYLPGGPAPGIAGACGKLPTMGGSSIRHLGFQSSPNPWSVIPVFMTNPSGGIVMRHRARLGELCHESSRKRQKFAIVNGSFGRESFTMANFWLSTWGNRSRWRSFGLTMANYWRFPLKVWHGVKMHQRPSGSFKRSEWTGRGVARCCHG